MPKPGATVTGEELIAHCRSLIAGYKVPKSIHVARRRPAEVRCGEDLEERTCAPRSGKAANARSTSACGAGQVIVAVSVQAGATRALSATVFGVGVLGCRLRSRGRTEGGEAKAHNAPSRRSHVVKIDEALADDHGEGAVSIPGGFVGEFVEERSKRFNSAALCVGECNMVSHGQGKLHRLMARSVDARGHR